MGLSLSLERGHEGCIHEVLQKDGCSSMYSIYICLTSCNVMYSRNMLQFPMFRESDSQYWLVFIFWRLKINHDSHEFKLESGIVANINHGEKKQTVVVIESNQMHMLIAHVVQQRPPPCLVRPSIRFSWNRVLNKYEADVLPLFL